jgi:hypothetical protein
LLVRKVKGGEGRLTSLASGVGEAEDVGLTADWSALETLAELLLTATLATLATLTAHTALAAHLLTTHLLATHLLAALTGVRTLEAALEATGALEAAALTVLDAGSAVAWVVWAVELVGVTSVALGAVGGRSCDGESGGGGGEDGGEELHDGGWLGRRVY